MEITNNFFPNSLCVSKGLAKSKLSYLRNYLADQAEIWCTPEADMPLSLISFLLKLIHELGFCDDLNFLKIVCNRSSCRKF